MTKVLSLKAALTAVLELMLFCSLAWSRTPAGPASKGELAAGAARRSGLCPPQNRSRSVAGDRPAACPDFIDAQTVPSSALWNILNVCPAKASVPRGEAFDWPDQ